MCLLTRVYGSCINTTVIREILVSRKVTKLFYVKIWCVRDIDENIVTQKSCEQKLVNLNYGSYTWLDIKVNILINNYLYSV